ncbi:MAG TPA: sulfite exporter TauE/SafE family protein [Candidatus Eisenbacteria bacterium]|jgi:sulfite exporter TauE/SafE/copper chaperone CopZ|nr:sulfite exporter TauE/SafE family protein [Candidatus Eisenbacteria bacterium]
MTILKLRVRGLNRAAAPAFEKAASVDGVSAVETWHGRAEVRCDDPSAASRAIAALRAAGFDPVEEQEKTTSVIAISGMTCRSCEIAVEKGFRRLPGVAKVDVDAAKGTATIVSEGRTPSLADLQEAIKDEGYSVRGMSEPAFSEKPSLAGTAAVFAAVLAAAWAFSKTGLLDRAYTIGGQTTFAGAVLIGLVAGSSSCVAVAGGLLLSSAKKFRERYGGLTAAGRMKPVMLFVGGRLASYTLLGGAIGLAGKAISPPPLATGALIILAAVYMILMGLDMLGLAPSWLLRLMPKMPKSLGRRILDADGREHPVMPAVLGGATFFLPCGFTQALQLYALTSGSFAAGATVLGGFALGTAPMLLGIGWASSSLKGRAGAMFFRFAGALVVVLGLWNVQNGLTVAGHPLALPKFEVPAATADAGTAKEDPNVAVEGDTQVITMTLLGQEPFYAPSDRFTVKAGKPVRLVINGLGMGCRSMFQIPKFNVKLALSKPVNVVEFTPTATGEAVFSCSMGMYRGSLNVVKG